MGRLEVNPVALRAVADEFDTAANDLDGLARLQLAFGAAVAGRVHAGDGAALRQSWDALLGEFRGWARAAAEIGASLRDGVDGYTGAEADATTGIG